MAGSFFERLDELAEMVGQGKLGGKVTFDQVYAFAQEESTWLTGPLAGHVITEHPHGGGPKYLEGALLEGVENFYGHIAEKVLDEGSVAPMVDDAEKLADDSAARAPIEFGDLRESAHPVVTDDGATVYDRPPIVPRLSRSELAQKARGRSRGDYHRTYLPEHHPLHGTLHEVHGGTHHHTKATKPVPEVDERR